MDSKREVKQKDESWENRSLKRFPGNFESHNDENVSLGKQELKARSGEMGLLGRQLGSLSSQ